MKKTNRPWTALLATTLVAMPISAFADDDAKADRSLNLEETSPPLNHFGLSYRMGFKISADFKNIGFLQITPPPNVPLTDRIYDNGYNRVDSTTNGSGLTSFWGYQTASQISPAQDTLTMTRVTSSQLNESTDVDGDPQHGLELSYRRQLGDVRRGHWGLEAAFGFTDLTFRDDRTVTSSGVLTADVYDITGLIAFGGPPPPPYSGPFGPVGPNVPVIPDTPISRAQTPFSSVPITGMRRIDAELYGWRFGPYLEMPVSDRVTVSLSGGLALALVNSTFRFEESITLPSGTFNDSGSGSSDEWLVGGYVGANVNYAVTARWSAFAGAHYIYLDNYSQNVGGKTATVDLSRSIFVTVGLGFSF